MRARRRASGRELAAAARHLIQPWPQAASIADERRALLRDARGVYVRDASGRRLLDAAAGMWCVNVGHGRRELAKAMYDQAMTLAYNSPWHSVSEPALALAQRIAGHAPGDLDHVFFTTGGSSAVESAIRFVHYYNNVLGRPRKKLLVCRDDGYHGSTYLCASLSARPRGEYWMDTADELVVRLSSPRAALRPTDATSERVTDGLIEEFATAIDRLGASRIAAFIAEPVMASGGVIVPPEDYLPRMRELCASNDILFVCDEVVTGFGRLGHVFASKAVFGVEPDIITFAKGVTSGYFPLGGMVVSARLVEALAAAAHPRAVFAHGLTYSGHPVGCAVALRNLDLLEGGLLEHASSVAPYLQARLRELATLALVTDVRGLGLMACVECIADLQRADAPELEADLGGRIDHHCQALGLLLRPLVNMCVMSPPLTITRRQVDDIVAMLAEALSRTMDDLERDGFGPFAHA